MERLNKEYGLDQPIYVQYWRWLSRIARLDFGRSFQPDARPVLTKIGERLPVTLFLNLIELANFYDVQGNLFSTFVNRDYADIRGFHVTLSKRRGVLTGSLRYNYSVATGKSSTPFNASPIFYEPRPGGSPASVLPSPKDIALDFDRTHNLILTVALQTPDAWGPVLADGFPLANVSLSVTSFARSGRPYTYDVGGLGVINNRRTPAEYNTDVKLSKRFTKLWGLGLTAYLEVFNLLNQKIYSYNTVFQSGSSTSSSGSNINRNIQIYETNKNALQYYDDFAPFLVDQTFLLYSNSPRSFQLGLVIDF